MSFGREGDLILDLIRGKISVDEFSRLFPADPAELRLLGLKLLREAMDTKDALGVEFGLYLGFHFGFSRDYLDVLRALANAEWHQRHEDVVSALDGLRAPEAVDELLRAAQSRHRYLDYDEAFALGVKAVWALGNIGTAEAISALQHILHSDNQILASAAENQLRRVASRSGDQSLRQAALAALNKRSGD